MRRSGCLAHDVAGVPSEKRFGIRSVPESTIELRRDVERSVLSCYGILPALFHPQAAGTALREAARTVHALSAVPVAELVAAQFSEALGEPVTLDLRRGRATDIATQARAVNSLVQAGLSVEDARAVIGI